VLDFAAGQGGEDLCHQVARGVRTQFHRDALAPAICFADEAIRRRSGGLEFLVHAIGSREQKQAKRYKQFLVTLSVIFPLTIFVPWVLQPLYQTMPFLG
jgi:antibiotic biosynthesis monooxygenase (ABM) superfamily enzyme